MMHEIGLIAGVLVLLLVLASLVGISLAERLPESMGEDGQPEQPTEGATGAYEEPEHVRIKREHYLHIRRRILDAAAITPQAADRAIDDTLREIVQRAADRARANSLIRECGGY